MSDLLGPNGKPVRAGESGYRDLQRTTLDAAVDRLAAGGATVAIVSPEPTGHKTAEGCTPNRLSEPAGECAAFLMRLRFDNQVRQQWVDTLKDKAARDRRVRLVGVADLFCRTQDNPCDDRLPLPENGTAASPGTTYARVDGSHFAPEIRERIADEVLQRVLDGAAQARR